jgi:hypothetical protein
MTKAENKMTDNDTQKDQRYAGYARIISPPEFQKVRPIQLRKILVPNLCTGPFDLKERTISTDHCFNLRSPQVCHVEPLLYSVCTIVTRNVLHDVAINGHFGEIRERQVQNRNGCDKPDGNQEQQTIRADIRKKLSEQSQIVRLP